MAYETLTVGQLKRELESFDDSTEVVVGSSYGDRAGTVQANFLEELYLVKVTDSDYSDTGYKIIEDDSEGTEMLMLNSEIMR